MTAKAPYKVLFLCTGNSARSVIAEYLLRARGKGRFESYSAGSHPTGKVNPVTIEVLDKHYGIDASAARSKSWDEYRGVKFDFVITVCDSAKESCPVWPGQPIVAHWGSPDPAAFAGEHEAVLRRFHEVATQINSRIGVFTAFRDEQLDEWGVRSVGEKFTLPSESLAKSR
jgi:arsenate reductase